MVMFLQHCFTFILGPMLAIHYPLEKTDGRVTKKRKAQCCGLTHHSQILSGTSEVWSVAPFKALVHAASFTVKFLGNPCISPQTLLQSGTTYCSLMGERLSGGRPIATWLPAYLCALHISKTVRTQQPERERSESVWPWTLPSLKDLLLPHTSVNKT